LAAKKASGKLLSPREKAELDVLSTGGSSRHAYLAAKKASGKLLSPREKAELDVLSTGGSSRHAYLAAKKASGKLLSANEEAELGKFMEGQFCSPSPGQTECVTPTGIVYKIDNSQSQLRRMFFKKLAPPTKRIKHSNIPDLK
jgi:hypothetical protein